MTIFKWKVRHHLLTVEMPKEKLLAKDIDKIADATASYDNYKKFVDNDGRELDSSWIGAMTPASGLALRVIQVACFVVFVANVEILSNN